MLVSLPSICACQSLVRVPCITTTDLFARALPHRSMLANCSSVHVSRSTDLTRLMCVPIPRCIPEHLLSPLSATSQQPAWHSTAVPYRMHINTPRFQLAHLGSMSCRQSRCSLSFQLPVYPRLFLLQSEQLLFVSSLTNCFNVFLFFSAGSTDGPLRDIVGSCV